jgi:stage III sporulation protein SpoIIIAA
MSNHTGIGLEVNLPEAKDRAVKLIVQLTGENPEKLHKMHIEDLIQYLSKLMQCRKEQIEELLVEHDQSKELDEVTLAMLWKLIGKGVVKGQKHTLGTIPEASFNQLKFIMAMLGDMARFRVENGLGAAGSTITAPSSTGSKRQSTVINRNSFLTSHQVEVTTRAIANNNISVGQKN